CQQYNILPCTF
nr:immunoglobulin light chain junction region [Macaca mulatta]